MGSSLEPSGGARHRRGDGLIFALVFVGYALTSPGDVIGDSETRWRVAERLAHHGALHVAGAEVEAQHGYQLDGGVMAVRGTGGRWYGWYGPGQSLALVPWVWAGDAVAGLGLPGLAGPGGGRLAGQFLVSVVGFPLVGAFAAVVLLRLARSLSGSTRAAEVVALCFALATMAWPHTVNTYEASQIAVCLLLATAAARRAIESRRRRPLVVMFLCMGVALTFRLTAAVPLIALGLSAMTADLIRHRSASGSTRWHRTRDWLLAGAVGLLPCLVLIAVYNQVRFGSPWSTGYAAATAAQGLGRELFGHHVGRGAAGMWLSPGKSALLYNPIWIAALLGWFWLIRGQRWLGVAVGAGLVLTTLFFARVSFWAGDVAWGPRYLAPLSGWVMLGLLPWLTRPPRWRRPILAGLITLSVAVQVAGVAYNPALEFRQHPDHTLRPDSYTWDVTESHWLLRGENLARHALGRRAGAGSGDDVPAQLRAVHFFPFKFQAVSGDGFLYRLLLTAWGVGIVLWLALGLWWLKRHRLLVEAKHEEMI